MASNIKHLTRDTFAAFIGRDKVLVDFWATWCGPCGMQGQILETLEGEGDYGSKIGKLNVDEERELAIKYSVSSIPTLIVFSKGEEVRRFVGIQQAAAIKKILD